MLIRLANTSDAPALQKLNDLFNGEGCNTIEAIGESLAKNEQEIVCVAAEGDELAGFCCGQVMRSMCYPRKYGEITELYVVEAYRRRGIGGRLLRATEHALNERGVGHLHVLTDSINMAAQTLYGSCGYAITSEILLDKN